VVEGVDLLYMSDNVPDGVVEGVDLLYMSDNVPDGVVEGVDLLFEHILLLLSLAPFNLQLLTVFCSCTHTHTGES